MKGKGREPGVEVMWRGIRRLEDVAIGVSLTKGNLFNEDLRKYQPEYG